LINFDTPTLTYSSVYSYSAGTLTVLYNGIYTIDSSTAFPLVASKLNLAQLVITRNGASYGMGPLQAFPSTAGVTGWIFPVSVRMTGSFAANDTIRINAKTSNNGISSAPNPTISFQVGPGGTFLTVSLTEGIN
jgi:hypothetical protein